MIPDPNQAEVKQPELQAQPRTAPTPKEDISSSESAKRARGLAGLITGLISRNGKKSDAPAAPDEAPELLDLLLEGPDALVVVHCEHGEIIEVSNRFCEWSGRTREELLDRPLLSLFPERENRPHALRRRGRRRRTRHRDYASGLKQDIQAN